MNNEGHDLNLAEKSTEVDGGEPEGIWSKNKGGIIGESMIEDSGLSQNCSHGDEEKVTILDVRNTY